MDVYRPVFSTLTCQIMQRVKVALSDMAHAYSMHLADLGSIDRPPLNLKQRPSDPLEAFYGEISNGITIMPTRLCFDIVLHPQNNVEAYDAEFKKHLMGLIHSRHLYHDTIVFAWVHKPLFQHILNSRAQITGRANVDSTFILGAIPDGFIRDADQRAVADVAYGTEAPKVPAQPTDEDYAAIADYNAKAPKKVMVIPRGVGKSELWKIYSDALREIRGVTGIPDEQRKTIAARQVLDELLAPIVSVEKVNPFKYEVATCAFQEMKRRRREERAKYNECHNSGPTEHPYTRQDRIDEKGYAIAKAVAAPAEHTTIHTMMRSPPRVMQAWPHEPRVFRRIK